MRFATAALKAIVPPIIPSLREEMMMELERTPKIQALFLNDLFTHLDQHLKGSPDHENRLRIVREAHQYLRSAHALFATAATRRRVENARDVSKDGLRGLLNALFDSASEELDELEEDLLFEVTTASVQQGPPIA